MLLRTSLVVIIFTTVIISYSSISSNSSIGESMMSQLCKIGALYKLLLTLTATLIYIIIFTIYMGIQSLTKGLRLLENSI